MAINLEELQNSLAELEEQNEDILKEIHVKETETLIKGEVLRGRQRALEVLEIMVNEVDNELAQAELDERVLDAKAEKLKHEALFIGQVSH